MAAHSSILAWEIQWIEEPGRLQSMGSQRVGHDWARTHSNLYNISPKRENPKIKWATCILIFLIPSLTFFPSSFSSFLLLFQTFYGGSLTYVEFNSKGICYLAVLFYRVRVTYYLNINPVKKGVWLFKRLLISHVTVLLCLLMKLRVELREQSFLFSMLFPLTVLMTSEMTLLGKETQSQACISRLLLLFSHSVMSSALQPRIVGSSVLHFWSLLRFLSFELVMPSKHLILCSLLLLLPSFISRYIWHFPAFSLHGSYTWPW